MYFLNPDAEECDFGHAVEAIQEFWHPHVRLNVEARYELGKRINSLIGQPGAQRDPVYDKVIEKLAWRLGLDVRTLQRVRFFASSYETFQEFAAEEDCPCFWLVHWSRESGMRPPHQVDEENRI